jgi:hypothetical protein
MALTLTTDERAELQRRVRSLKRLAFNTNTSTYRKVSSSEHVCSPLYRPATSVITGRPELRRSTPRSSSGSGPFGPIFNGVWQSLQPVTLTRYWRLLRQSELLPLDQLAEELGVHLRSLQAAARTGDSRRTSACDRSLDARSATPRALPRAGLSQPSR